MGTVATKKMDQARDAVLRALEVAGQDPRPPEAIREAAEAIVELRRLHEHEGRPDWAGRSPEYRMDIETLYRRAGVESDSKGGIQANLRYHVGNAIRRAAPAEDLEALGLTTAGPAERSRTSRMVARRQAGRPERPRDIGADIRAAVGSFDNLPTSVDPVFLLRHAQQDVALARELTGSLDALVAARELLDSVVAYVGELAHAQ